MLEIITAKRLLTLVRHSRFNPDDNRYESHRAVCVQNARTLSNVVWCGNWSAVLKKMRAIDREVDADMEDSLTHPQTSTSSASEWQYTPTQVTRCGCSSFFFFFFFLARDAIGCCLRSNHYRLSSFNLTVFGWMNDIPGAVRDALPQVGGQWSGQTFIENEIIETWSGPLVGQHTSQSITHEYMQIAASPHMAFAMSIDRAFVIFTRRNERLASVGTHIWCVQTIQLEPQRMP